MQVGRKREGLTPTTLNGYFFLLSTQTRCQLRMIPFQPISRPKTINFMQKNESIVLIVLLLPVQGCKDPSLVSMAATVQSRHPGPLNIKSHVCRTLPGGQDVAQAQYFVCAHPLEGANQLGGARRQAYPLLILKKATH